MSLLLDQNMPHTFFRALIAWQYPVTLLGQHIAIDADDRDVIELAQQLDAVLLTCDLDFSDIRIYPPQQYAGIVVLRYKSIDEPQVMLTLKEVLEEFYRDDLRGKLVIVEASRYRIRNS